MSTRISLPPTESGQPPSRPQDTGLDAVWISATQEQQPRGLYFTSFEFRYSERAAAMLEHITARECSGSQRACFPFPQPAGSHLLLAVPSTACRSWRQQSVRVDGKDISVVLKSHALRTQVHSPRSRLFWWLIAQKADPRKCLLFHALPATGCLPRRSEWDCRASVARCRRFEHARRSAGELRRIDVHDWIV